MVIESERFQLIDFFKNGANKNNLQNGGMASSSLFTKIVGMSASIMSAAYIRVYYCAHMALRQNY